MSAHLSNQKPSLPNIPSAYPSILFALALILFSVLFSYLSSQSKQRLQHINEQHYRSYVLVTQLSQQIEQLSYFARQFVLTGEVKYLNSYHELINIRGKEQEKSLKLLMKDLNFSVEDVSFLSQVESSAISLSELELSVFSEVEEKIQVINEYLESDLRLQAISPLFSTKYQQEKESIKLFITDFLELQQSRVDKEAQRQSEQYHLFFLLSVICLLCSIFCLLFNLKRQSLNKALFVKILRKHVSERTLELFDKREHLKVVIKDMDETKNQLVESEKMASLGNLVSGVAHEVNTPLGISVTLGTHLQSELKILLEKVESGTLKRSDLDNYCNESMENCTLLQSNLERAATLISSFKQVAVDRTCDEVRVFKLSEYIDEILLSLHPRLKRTAIKVAVTVTDDEPFLNTYPGALAQIITNLVMNSLIHAFNDGEDAGHINFSLSLKGENMLLSYTDDGKGMAAETSEHIFEPFFTTRRGSGGSGLGMHIVYNLVVRRLNGTIKCESEIDKGTCFIIRFPIEAKV